MIVVTDVELGWDCVVVVTDSMEKAIEYMNDCREEDLTEEEWNNQGVYFHNTHYYSGQ